MGYTLHFISHTHWDREWYMSFEEHRIRLVEFMDSLLDVLKHDDNYKSFHLDGQIIILDDYLEIRPYKVDEIKKYISEGRIQIGPWYVLQDEFLTSGEANIRNLLYGIKYGEKYGAVCKIGYFPDTFGNISQMPQILNGFGIDCAVVGRGVNPDDNGKYSSEFLWKSPDGSMVLTAFLAGWYNNASEIPEKLDEAREFIKNARDRAASFTGQHHLLMMNGCDHQPVQKNLTSIIASVQNEFSEDILLHSNFIDYFDYIKSIQNKLQIIEGELTGQETDGFLTLVNTASSRIYLKQLNHKAQTLLEKWVEPLGTIGWLAGDSYRTDFLNKAWLYLLQNHPHDSICGCSIDDVHEEMIVRYKKSIAISNSLIERETKFITDCIDTTFAEAGDIPVVVFNPLGWTVSEKVEVDIDYDENTQIEADGFSAVDSERNVLNCDTVDMGRVFTYELPEDSFRNVKFVKRLKVNFIAKDLPPMGYKTYVIRKKENETKHDFKFAKNFAENKYLRLDIGYDGTLFLMDKTSGHVYNGLNVLEDSCDMGDEYNFTNPDEDVVSTEGQAAEINIWERGRESVTFAVSHKFLLPECAYKERKLRSDKKKELTATSYITMTAESRRLDIATEVDNQIADHRLRVIFKANIKTEYCWVDGHFDIVQRKIQTGKRWKNPSNCQRQQVFVDLFDGRKGLIIANRGLPEYEVLRDNYNSVALTLFRAVGELGDWGYFPTPGAQCYGKHRFEYSIIPYSEKEGIWFARKQAYVFNGGPLLVKTTGIHTGKYRPDHSFINISGEYINISALKKSEDRESVILRVYNQGETDEMLKIPLWYDFLEIYETDLKEERKKVVKSSGGLAEVIIPSRKIKTFELTIKGKEVSHNSIEGIT